MLVTIMYMTLARYSEYSVVRLERIAELATSAWDFQGLEINEKIVV